MPPLAPSRPAVRSWCRPFHLPVSDATKDWTPEEIRALRQRLRWNQTRFAEAIGYSHQTSVSDLEKRGEDGEPKSRPSGPVIRLLDLLDRYDGRFPEPESA